MISACQTRKVPQERTERLRKLHVHNASRTYAMLIRTYTPQAPLSGFVDYFWYFEGYAPPHSKELSLPDGSIELVINLNDDKIKLFDREYKDPLRTYGSSVICGPHSEYFIIDTSAETTVLGIHFKPGGISPYLKMPVNELHNTHVSLDALWGASAYDLREMLLQSQTLDDKFRILEANLIKLASRPLIRHPAVSFALNEFMRLPHTRPISDVIDQIGLSQRRFIQIF